MRLSEAAGWLDKAAHALRAVDNNVVITKHPYLKEWNGIPCQVLGEKDNYLRLKPLQDRPDGYGRNEFNWVKERVDRGEKSPLSLVLKTINEIVGEKSKAHER